MNPDRIFASQTSSWFGQVIQRSDDGGRTWAQLAPVQRRPVLPERLPGVTATCLFSIHPRRQANR